MNAERDRSGDPWNARSTQRRQTDSPKTEVIVKVFISWSGPRSRTVALTLRGWLREVIQSVDPFVSTAISAGARWGEELDTQLATTDFGIVCVTPENLDSRWLNYEAGALGKAVGVARVVPYLIGMREHAEVVDSPLTRFQAKLAMTETLGVIESLNQAIDRPIESPLLNTLYDRAWPALRQVLETLPEPEDAPDKPDDKAILRDILETVRGIQNGLVANALSPNFDSPRLGRLPLFKVQRQLAHFAVLQNILVESLEQRDVDFVVSGAASGVPFTILIRHEQLSEWHDFRDLAAQLMDLLNKRLKAQSAAAPSPGAAEFAHTAVS
jgi:TIR domain